MARFSAWLVAWLGSAWLCVQLTDWAFAPRVPAGLVPLAWLAWLVVGGMAVVQGVRASRPVSLRKVVLLAAAMPATLVLQVILVASPIEPPTDIRLMTEFRQLRPEFEELAALARPELAAFARLEGEPRAAGGSPPIAHAVQSRLRGVVGVRQPGPCLEIIRWSAGSSAWGFEVGFLYSERPPELVEIPIDRETFLRDGLREYYRLDAHWYLFRAAW